MRFRYKVYIKRNAYTRNGYYVKIQEHTGWPIFQWETVLDEALGYVLHKINPGTFTGYSYVFEIPNKDIYDELKQYKSVEEIIMKYIKNVILKDYQEKRNNDLCDDLIGKFVLTNGWNTIEIKENEK